MRPESTQRMKSRLVGLGHEGEAAQPRLERGSAALLMRGGPNKSRQGPLHQVAALHSADPHQRIRHCRPPKTKVIRGRFLLMAMIAATRSRGPVQRAPERAGVRRRRTRARLLLVGRHRIVAALLPHGDRRAPRRGRPLDRESNRRRRRRRQRGRARAASVQVHGRGGAREECGRSGGEA